MGNHITEAGNRENSMDSVHINGLITPHTKGITQKDLKMERANTQIQTEQYFKVYGQLAKEKEREN